MSSKHLEELMYDILTKKMKDFEDSCNLFDLPPPQPPKLMRTYKAFCLCGRTTHVYNKEREGGVCFKCYEQSKISKL